MFDAESADLKTTKKKTTKKEPSALVRKFKENGTFYSDLFKLQLGKALQYVGFRKESKNAAYDREGNLHPDWLTKEHSHFYRTVDSKGKVQEFCTPACGHTHRMKVNRNSAGEIISVECDSGPLSMQVTDKYGKKERVHMPVNDFDDHKHETIYVRSDKLQNQSINVEAAKVISREASKNSKDVFDNEGKKLETLAVQ